MMVNGSDPHELMPSSGDHQASVIWFHGMTQQGSEWINKLSPISAMNVKIICPNAAARPIAIAFNLSLPAWFNIYGLSLESPEDVEGIQAATFYAHSLILNEIEAGVNPKKIAIGGYSMGGALALHAALTFPIELGATVGLSSFLLQRDIINAECVLNRELPVFLGHGVQDNVVSYMYAQMTQEKLRTFNPNVTLRSYSFGHDVTDQEIDDVSAFLKQQLCL